MVFESIYPLLTFQLIICIFYYHINVNLFQISRKLKKVLLNVFYWVHFLDTQITIHYCSP